MEKKRSFQTRLHTLVHTSEVYPASRAEMSRDVLLQAGMRKTHHEIKSQTTLRVGPGPRAPLLGPVHVGAPLREDGEGARAVL